MSLEKLKHRKLQTPQSKISQRTADTALGALLEVVPQLEDALMRTSSPKSPIQLFQTLKLTTLSEKAEVDQILRRDITTSFLPQRQRGESQDSSEELKDQPRLPSAYQEDIQRKFYQYSQVRNRAVMIAKKRTVQTQKFTAKDFFGGWSSQTVEQKRDTPEITTDQFLQEFNVIKTKLVHCIKISNIKQMLVIFQSLLLVVMKTRNSIILAYVLFFCGSITQRLQDYKYSIYFYEQCRIVSNLNIKRLLHLKLSVMTQLGICTRDVKLFDQSIVIFKKALQYAWFLTEKSQETILYDHIGLSYYYQCNMQKSMQYHHRSAKDISEPENSPMRVLSNETLVTFMNRVNTDVPHPEVISQGVLNHLNMPFLSINQDFQQVVEGIQPLKRGAKRVSHYKEFFKSNRISLSTSNLYSREFAELENKSLMHLVYDYNSSVNRMLLDREFQFTLQTPRAEERVENKFVQRSPVRFFHPKASSLHTGIFGPEHVLPDELRYNPSNYKMPLESMIQYRNEAIGLKRPVQVNSHLHLNKRVCISHLSKNRGNLTSKSGLVIDELVKIVEASCQSLIKQIQDIEKQH